MMDDRTYKRMFTETKVQMMARHNGISIYGTRKCRTCNPQGAVNPGIKCTSPKPCSQGWRQYRRA